MLEAGDQPGPTCCAGVLVVPSTKELQLGKRRQKKKKQNPTTALLLILVSKRA